MARNKTQIGEKYNAPFPTALRKLMEERGETQENIAKAAEKTRQTVSQYVNGISEPGYETLVKIADYFNVSADYLLGRTEDPRRVPSAMDELGLSERSLEWFKSLKQGSSTRDNMSTDICAIVEDAYFQLLMYNLREYGKAVTAEVIYDKGWEYYFPKDCVMYQDVALQKHEEFKNAIAKIAHSGTCDGYVSKYLELVSFLNTDGTDGAGVTKLADLLVGVEGFTPSELCAHRVSKYLTLLMESIKSQASDDENTHYFDQKIEQSTE